MKGGGKMKTLLVLIKRNTKIFFKDKAMFFTAMITPGILLVLYTTFLGNLYYSSFADAIPEGMHVSEDVLDAAVAAQLVSSLLAVSCVTVAFCTNMLSVQDKANGTARDLLISPISPGSLSLGYYIASLISTLAVCLGAGLLCFLYMAAVGWYLSFLDVILIILDILLLTLFGVALSSVINFFLSTQGQISAIGTIVSAGYGFICGAYMPISQFSEGLRNAVAFLPGTHATALLRNHAMRGTFEAMRSEGLPEEFINSLGDSVDCRIYLFGDTINTSTMYITLGGSAIALVIVYILMNLIKMKKSAK